MSRSIRFSMPRASRPFRRRTAPIQRPSSWSIWGGRTTRDGIPSTERQASARLGATLAIPVTSRHSVKLGYFAGLYTRLGSDFDNLVVAWQYRWGGGI